MSSNILEQSLDDIIGENNIKENLFLVVEEEIQISVVVVEQESPAEAIVIIHIDQILQLEETPIHIFLDQQFHHLLQYQNKYHY